MASLPPLSVLRRVGGLTVAAGALLAVAGSGAWFAVTKQLRAEKITVPGNAPILAGKTVQDPVTAYVEAVVIKATPSAARVDARSPTSATRCAPSRKAAKKRASCVVRARRLRPRLRFAPR